MLASARSEDTERFLGGGDSDRLMDLGRFLTGRLLFDGVELDEFLAILDSEAVALPVPLSDP